ncbi:CALCINEURIN-LIKE METALLO-PHOSPHOESTERASE SUPERFAMILY PROTEIN [Salix purpurea]|uniref:CALCINEURIN-LIKE METALLO-PHOSPHOESTERASE SUPERFAMILY PROTEIN n=1 Tax=Salix purpurea TaxID=77065 RepID=A0A9Q1AJJ1_SALPP|nr:CALCINEURIN-LIKE METALLO-PHOSPHOESTERASE SUPERFAMILY PROTEIN [Salix purpurea]
MGKRSWWLWWMVVAVGVGVVGVAAIGTRSGAGEGEGKVKVLEPLVTRIAFGSCANQSDPQPIWNAIIEFDPQVFIWLGDNVYGDVKRPFKLFGKERTVGPWKNAPRFIPSPPKELESRYQKAKSNPGYSRLRHTTQVVGTWDDHDYGLNDAGKEFGGKITNQKLLLDFLDEPQDSPRRKQEGVYTSYMFGPVGRQIKVILLDTRYHRDPLRSDGSVLGSSQWTWLEKELNGPKSAITIIGSSVQVISNLSATTSPLFSLESWGRFPKERNRLFKLIADTKREGVFFISGDVHFGEISRYDCSIGYPFDSEICGMADTNDNESDQQKCRFRSCTYGQPNFGAIEIVWSTTPVTLKLEVRDIKGYPVTGVKFPLVELQSRGLMPSVKAGEYRRHCSLEVNLPWMIKYRLAILFYCSVSVLLLAMIGLAYAATLAFRLFLHKCKLD